MTDTKYKYELEWTRDCQGKWDYDSGLVHLSCRYYPSGGGFSVLHTSTGEWEENDARPEIRPSAFASILVGDMLHEVQSLARAEFEGDTEREVKQQVEKWANEMIIRIEKALLAEFSEEES